MTFIIGDTIKWVYKDAAQKVYIKAGIYLGATKRTHRQKFKHPVACVRIFGKSKTKLIPFNQIERLEQ